MLATVLNKRNEVKFLVDVAENVQEINVAFVVINGNPVVAEKMKVSQISDKEIPNVAMLSEEFFNNEQFYFAD